MPWSETGPMNERVKFVASYLGGLESFSELCRDHGVSRKTGYKWIGRYERGGVSALVDLPRVAHSHPHAVRENVVKEILGIRRKHPNWGPRKLLVILEREKPELDLPVASTVGEILRRHGLNKKRKRIRRSSPYGNRLSDYAKPNAVWCADFKGHFPVGEDRCHPLTITDGHSRYLITCKALRRPLSEPSRRVFESAFREFGLPDAIRTDNGAPFSTLAPGGLSRLAIWWIRLGIKPERILPGHPEQNGRHERMHGTLKMETAKPPRSSFRAQQRSFDKFREEYNQVRPHEALNQQVPSTFYKASNKPFPNQLPEPEYPTHFQIQRAYPNGVISFQSTQWYISACLKGELLGLEQVNEERAKVYFGPIALGILDARMAKDRSCRQFGMLIRLDGELNSAQKRRKLRL